MKYYLVTLILIGLYACGANSELNKIEKDQFAEAKSLYASNCASCHGQQMAMFVDRNWKHGSDPDSLALSIKKGYPDDGMPAFEALFSEEQVQELVKYITYGIDNRESFSFDDPFNPDTIFETDGLKYRLELISDEVDVPWGYAFLPDNSMLITDISGELYHRSVEGELQEIGNVPEVVHAGQGGLMDVELDPDFETNNLVYISYSKGKDDKQTTAVIRAKLGEKQLEDVTEIFEALPYLSTRHHYGGRLEFDPDGYLMITVGDRGRRDDNPQSLENHCGKVHRINSDGSIPQDNPFVGQANAMESIYSYGHRNPQGLIYDADRGIMWEHEHGPRGGDELNIVRKGENFGWPVVSFGINYNGTTFTNKTEMEGMTEPEKYWVPSIAPCGMALVYSDLYPEWKGDLLIGSLRFKYVTKVSEDMSEVSMLKNIGRVRNVKLDREGYIYVSVEEPGAIYKLIPILEN
ncbi:PQQ-dependent sugar dehydrogenase [Portibacter marinus]|uniref:PQQ-dependent sugar dehydrogenase n=1 Tax=Portibacter marinus TaxID=2898660 RepID=UPI001F20D48B|nr:PQQ-dependent sugar dehydrogenase [Portibacter marinus]